MNVWIYLYTIDNFYLYPSFKVCNLILKEVASSFFSIFAYKERMCVKRFSVVSPSEHKSNMEQGTSKFKFALNSALHEFDERCHSLNALVSVNFQRKKCLLFCFRLYLCEYINKRYFTQSFQVTSPLPQRYCTAIWGLPANVKQIDL